MFYKIKTNLKGLENPHLIIADANDFDTNEQYERVVSIEMFEHMGNWPILFNGIESWLKRMASFSCMFFVTTTPRIILKI